MYILGISAYYHDSACALIHNGEIVAAAQEERFSRVKHDSRFPGNALSYCLEETSISIDDIDHIVFYDKPFLTFERLLETYLQTAPQGLMSFIKAIPIWVKEKLFIKTLIRKEIKENFGVDTKSLKILFTEHHQSHAASAFYPSPFNEANVLCLDGVGEWTTTSSWRVRDNKLDLNWELKFPHSLGLLYSAFTYYIGFKVNSGEYKLMGLAPYGTPKYKDLILKELVDVKKDGTFRLNMKFFKFHTGLKMINSKFENLFGQKARVPETEIEQFHMDIASSIQSVTEDIVLALVEDTYRENPCDNLCLAGGVALNCVANSVLKKKSSYKNIWIQPAAGDAGGSLGAALSVWHDYLGNKKPEAQLDQMKGAYLGPSFSLSKAKKVLDELGATYKETSYEDIIERTSEEICNQSVVGWFQGRMEFGPRALGNRSILGDPRSEKMQSIMNLKIKFRESFRPFAPSVLEDKVHEWFEHEGSSPYMLLTAKVNKEHLLNQDDNSVGLKSLSVKRSSIPAITHVNNTARLQTVSEKTNKKYYDLLNSFYKKTNVPVLINTSFNVRGEPIVCNVEDAYRCFMRTDMDILVIDNLILDKKKQLSSDIKDWKFEGALD